MRTAFLALCLAIIAFPSFAETPKLEDFPIWSDRFARCAALYTALGDEMERKAAPDNAEDMAKVRAYRNLGKEAGFAAGTYARKSMVGISAGMVEEVFQENLKYFNAEVNAGDEAAAANIKSAGGECKKLLPIQQAITQASRQNAKKRITVFKDGRLLP